MTVEIYSKVDCCLCDEAKKVLMAARRKVPFEISEIDIEGDATLLGCNDMTCNGGSSSTP